MDSWFEAPAVPISSGFDRKKLYFFIYARYPAAGYGEYEVLAKAEYEVLAKAEWARSIGSIRDAFANLETLNLATYVFLHPSTLALAEPVTQWPLEGNFSWLNDPTITSPGGTVASGKTRRS